jgi:hypothetical protein
MIYEIPTGTNDLIIDIDTYSLLREEPEFSGIDENDQPYELNPEQMAIVMEWFEQNKNKVYHAAFQSVSKD